ncbi:putative phytosulfokines 6 [Rhododendron vialii]|uniref:putative phytosulfokines 6 n=1 Tax=Rhododendron vialii TaxID=182163 RepID=UPI00265F11F7|nr:putative phytosulfokines 6 [Rhododendron vialii]
MKQSLHSAALLLSLLLLITTSQALARFLATKQGEEEPRVNEITTGVTSPTETEEDDSMNLMGILEDCHGGDEECVKRRMDAEAHLDYIYTQHLKP